MISHQYLLMSTHSKERSRFFLGVHVAGFNLMGFLNPDKINTKAREEIIQKVSLCDLMFY